MTEPSAADRARRAAYSIGTAIRELENALAGRSEVGHYDATLADVRDALTRVEKPLAASPRRRTKPAADDE